MFGFKKKIKLVTHENRFHTDDVFSTAILMILLGEENIEVIRTSDKEIIESGDYVYDTGGIYDENKNRFDHHQEISVGQRKNGIPYSSFGLIWKKYGEQICGSKIVANELDKKIVQFVDAGDNGKEICRVSDLGIYPYTLDDIILAFNSSWNEVDSFELFIKVTKLAKKILKREIEKIKILENIKPIIKDIYEKTEDKRIIVLDRDYPYDDILNKYSEPIFVVVKKKNKWNIKAIRNNLHSFENRKDFPKEWAGKTNEDLQKITGVEDVLFCHNKRFICVTKSKEGAIVLAKLALTDSK